MKKTAIACALIIAIGAASSAGAAKLITGGQIKNGSIGLADLSRSARRQLRGQAGPRGAQGAAGPQGPAGPPGSQGPAGAAGLSGVQVVDGPSITLGPGDVGGAPTADCPAGKVVIGTGFNASIGWAGFVRAYGTFVGGFFLNDTSISVDVNVQAICASTTGAAAASLGSGREEYGADVRKAREQYAG